jgi:hypothetical protein
MQRLASSLQSDLLMLMLMMVLVLMYSAEQCVL